MKQRNFYFSGFIAIIIGTVIILTYRHISSSGIINVCGCLFILVGLLNLLYTRSRRKAVPAPSALSMTVSVITSVGATVLGLSLLIFNETFASVIMIVFGIYIAILALQQYYVVDLSSARKYLSRWFLLSPLALVAFTPSFFLSSCTPDEETRILEVGIATAVFGVASVIEAIVLSRKVPAPTAKPENDTPVISDTPPTATPKPLDDPEEE